MLDELKVRIGALRGEFEKNRDISDPAKKFSAQVGGMLEIETITIDQNEANRNLYGDINNDYGFRDIRLWVKGMGTEPSATTSHWDLPANFPLRM
jgi:hypothetical protein